MKSLWIILHLCLVLNYFFSQNSVVVDRTGEEISWPSSIQGHELSELPLSNREKKWSKNFPGAIARFQAGDKEFILRSVRRPTRKLHPIADCLKGVGFKVKPEPLERDSAGQLWGCSTAERAASRLRVCEITRDKQGRSWSDVSSWWWAATLKQTTGPWLSVVRIEPV